MAINTKNRKDLKSYFVKNAIPTEANFADLVDAQLNQSDDGVFKLAGEPLSVVAAGGDQKRVLRLYSSYPAPNPDWLISLNPAQDPADAATNRPGFGITDNAGTTRMFIDPATGNLGVGTNTPGDRLTVKDGDLRIEGGSHRRLKIVSDRSWVGIDLVAREQGELGHPYIDFTHGQLDAPDFGVRLLSADNQTLTVAAGAGTALLSVAGSLAYSGTQSKLDVAEQGAATVRASDLWFGHSGRRGTPGRALVDSGNALVVNYNNDWPRTAVHGPLTVSGNLGIGATDPEYPLDIRLPSGTGAWNRFVVTTTPAWGDVSAQHVVIGAAASGIMFWNPHVPWMGGQDNRASIRYGRTGGAAGNTFWDVGVRADGSFSFNAFDGGATAGDLLKISKAGVVSAKGAELATVAAVPKIRTGDVQSSIPNGFGARTIKTRIEFGMTFSAPPTVLAVLRGLDAGREFNTRIQLSVEAINTTGFTIVYLTWADAIVWNAMATWIAIGF
jgi:hypothetical protein